MRLYRSNAAGVDEGVGVALEAFDAPGALALPGRGRVGRVPCLEQSPLLRVWTVAARVGSRHIERRPRHLALGRVRRLEACAGNFGRACAERGRGLRQFGEGAVAPRRVDGVHGGKEIVHVRLHEAEFPADPARAFPPAKGRAVPAHARRMPAPRRERPPEMLHGHGVFPRHALRPPPGGRRKARWQPQALLLREARAAIERRPAVVVDCLKPCLGLTEALVDRVAAGAGAAAEKDGDGCQQKNRRKESRMTQPSP